MGPYLFQFETWQIFDYSNFTGSISTVHNSLKIMFQNFTFWCYPGYDTCLSVLSIPFMEEVLISPAVRPQSKGK